jgi:hypothetical protein
MGSCRFAPALGSWLLALGEPIREASRNSLLHVGKPNA